MGTSFQKAASHPNLAFYSPKNDRMNTEYRIALHARTASGFETLAELYIGHDRRAANQLFRTLKGSPDDSEKGLLFMELC